MESPIEQLPETDGLIVYEKKAIERVNPIREKLNELKEIHKVFPDLSTTAGQKTAKEQIKSFRDLKGVTEKERKDVKCIINKLAKTVDESYNAVWDDAAKEQEWRDAKLKEFEEEKERIKKEKEESEKKLFMSRQAELTSLGAIYSDEHFILGDYSIEGTLIGTSSEEIWQNHILSGFKDAYAVIEAERADEKRLEQERQEKLRIEQEELQRMREEYQKQQAELKKQQEQFEAKQREYERLEMKRRQDEEQRKRWEEENARREAKLIEKTLFDNRVAALSDVIVDGGMVYYKGHEVLSYNDIVKFSDQDFNKVKDLHNKRVEEERIEKEAEDKKKELLRERRTLLHIVEVNPVEIDENDLMKMSENEFLEFYNKFKKIFEDKRHKEWLENERIKKIQEAEAEKSRISELKENKRWKEWVESKLIPFMGEIPKFENKRYVRAKAIAVEKIEEIILLKPGNF